MASLNDEKYRFLRGEGYTGALPDMWRNYLVTVAGALVDSTEVNDLWLALFRDKGYEGALPDVWRQWLLENGYTDEKDYWKDVIDGIAPAPDDGGIFDGTYWFSPLSNNGNDTITDGFWSNSTLSPKNVELTTGLASIPAQSLATFPNHAVTREVSPEVTNLLPTDLSSWSNQQNSVFVYDDVAKENVWTFTGGTDEHSVFQSTVVTLGLDYTLSFDVSKGESQFIQVSGNAGFDFWVVNFDLISGTLNVRADNARLKTKEITDQGDFYRIIVTAEANQTRSGRFVIAKAESLNDLRQPDTDDTGQFTIRYPNFVQGSEAPEPPIDNPDTAPFTRPAIFETFPVSGVLVEPEATNQLVNSNSFTPLNGAVITSTTEEDPRGNFTASRVENVLQGSPNKFSIGTLGFSFQGPTDCAGGIWIRGTSNSIGQTLYFAFLRGNAGDTNIVEEIITLTAEWKRIQLTTTLEPPNSGAKVILGTASGTTADEFIIFNGQIEFDATTLSSDIISVGGPTTRAADVVSCLTSNNFNDPAVLTWPGENVEFSFNFTPLSDEPSEVYHIEWANAAKDHYFGRNGVNYSFVHGNDTASFDTSLVNVNQTYAGKAIVTPSKLIIELDGVEVARETRTDTQVAVWESEAYLGGFQTTLSPLIISQFRVKDYVAPPPANGFTIETGVVTGVTVYGFLSEDLGAATGLPSFGGLEPAEVEGQEIGGLIIGTITGDNPGELVSGLEVLSGGTGFDFTDIGDLQLSVLGFTLILTFDEGIYTVKTDNLDLFNAVQAANNTTVPYSIEAAPDFADNGDFANNGDFA